MFSFSDRALLTAVVADAKLILGYAISAVHPDRRVCPIGDNSWR